MNKCQYNTVHTSYFFIFIVTSFLDDFVGGKSCYNHRLLEKTTCGAAQRLWHHKVYIALGHFSWLNGVVHCLTIHCVLILRYCAVQWVISRKMRIHRGCRRSGELMEVIAVQRGVAVLRNWRTELVCSTFPTRKNHQNVLSIGIKYWRPLVQMSLILWYAQAGRTMRLSAPRIFQHHFVSCR